MSELEKENLEKLASAGYSLDDFIAMMKCVVDLANEIEFGDVTCTFKIHRHQIKRVEMSQRSGEWVWNQRTKE